MKVMKADEQPPIQSMSKEDRAELIKALQQEIEERNKEISTKFYVVEGGAATGKSLLEFMSKEAKWKFTEAIGVVECIRELNDAVKKAESGKELFLQVLPIEAIWFFINKVEDVGVEKASHYVNHLLKPVAEAMGRIKVDRDKVNELMHRQGALEVGADFEKETAVTPATEGVPAE